MTFASIGCQGSLVKGVIINIVTGPRVKLIRIRKFVLKAPHLSQILLMFYAICSCISFSFEFIQAYIIFRADYNILVNN